jgi:hypothetical protein
MKNKCAMALVCVIGLIPALLPNSAQAFDASNFQISRVGDLDMSCAHITREAKRMQDIIHSTQDIKDRSRMQERGIGAVGTAASFLVSTATGGLGIAAAGFVMSEINDDQGTSADNIQDIAQQRRSFMLGIYNAKGCFGPIENVMQSPDPEQSLIEQIASVEPASGDSSATSNAGFNN